MPVIYKRNPQDGTTTYDKMRTYRATSQSGSFSVVATTTIDTTTAIDQSSGYTLYSDTAGTSASWYKTSWYHSVSLAESDLTSAFAAGTMPFDDKIRRRLKDTNVATYFFTNEEIADFRERALQSLYPATWIDTVYEIAVTDNNKRSITVPFTVFRVDTIKVVNSNGDNCGEHNAYYKVGNTLYAVNSFPVGYTLRMVVTKPFRLDVETPEHFESYLLDMAELDALRTMETDRSRYYKYTTTIRPEGGNLPSLNRIISNLEESAARKLNTIRRNRESAFINLTS